MLVLADAAAQAPAVTQAVPTAFVAIISVVITTVGGVAVALIYKRGEGRTSKSDHVPEIIRIMERSNADLRARNEALVEDRDAWRDMAWRQVQESEMDTDEAFPSSRYPKHTTP